MRQETDEKLNALQNRFYGPLPFLDHAPTASSLSPLERELYLLNSLGDSLRSGFGNDTHKIYDLFVSPKVHILGKGMKESDGRKEYLLILRRDERSTLLSAHLYAKFDCDKPVTEMLARVEPAITLLFPRTNEVLVVDHAARKVTKMIGSQVVYTGGTEELGTFQGYAAQVLKDFTILYGRGSNQQVLLEKKN